VEAMSKTAFQGRNLGRAAKIYDAMLQDKECTIILCLAGSLFSAGLKGIVHDLITHNMVDAIVSTGANIVDQDFFEALGYRHCHFVNWYYPKTQKQNREYMGVERLINRYYC